MSPEPTPLNFECVPECVPSVSQRGVQGIAGVSVSPVPPPYGGTHSKQPSASVSPSQSLTMSRTRWDYTEVAAVYRAAGHRPTKAVADHFGVTKASATKAVARARDHGLLPTTTRGRVACSVEEHTPVRVRESGGQTKWTLCRSCVVEWPCQVALDQGTS